MAGEVDKGLVLRLEATTLLLTQQLRDARKQVDGFAEDSKRSITVSSAQQQNAIRNLGFQFNDMLTQVQGGTPILRAFAMQSGQAAGALSDMGGRAGQVGRFFSGILGGGILAAGTALATYLVTMDDTNKALDLAKVGATGLADAQSVLGEMFDLTSGKLKTQNDLLRANAQLTALNLRSEAQQQKASANKAFGQAGDLSAFPFFFQQGSDRAQYQAVQAFLNGTASARDTQKLISTLSDRGLKVSNTELQQALIDYLAAPQKEKIADLIEKSLDSGSLAGELRRPGASRKSGRKPSELDAWAQKMGFKDYDAWDRDQIEPLRRKAEQQEPFDSLTKGSDKFGDSLERIKVDTGDLIQRIDIAGGPMLELFDKLTMEADHLDEAFEEIAAQGLESLGDGITDAIMGAESLADAFGNVADQIIADLVRIAIRQAVIKPLAGMLDNTFSTSIFSKGLGFGGGRATGGPVDPSQFYMVGEHGRELFVPDVPGTIVPNHALSSFGSGGGSSLTVHVDARGATDPAMVRRQVEQGIMEAAPLLVAAAQGRTVAQLQRPRLPGSLG